MSLVKLGKQEALNTALLSQQLSGAHTRHTEQQAASITAECQAGSCRSQANPTGVGRQEEKISTQVNVRPSVKGQEFIILQHLRLASASALYRPYTGLLLTPPQDI